MRVTCERCLRRYDVPDATVKGRKIRARCKCGARVVVQDEERAAKSSPVGSHTTGSIQRPARWFVDITSWEPIAMDLRQLIRAFDAGRIDADTLVWRKGMPDWRRLREVSELADRLIGADAARKSAAPETPTEVSTAGSEPPARQSERSRTPPASYTVGAKPSADASPNASSRLSVPPPGDDARSSAPPLAESTGTLAGPSNGTVASNGARPSSVPSERVASLPPAPEGTASAAASGNRKSRAKSNGSKSSNGKANGRSDRLSSPGQGRTITQTGLSAPPELNRRFSAPPGNSSQQEAEGAGRPSVPGAPDSSPRNSRESRNPTLIGAFRRIPSSDETPAQKPSSISVPPGAMSSTPQRPRGKRLLALAAVVIGGVLLAQRFVLSSQADEHELAARAEPSEQPKRVERTALESKPSTHFAPVPSLPSFIGPAVSDGPPGESKTPPQLVTPEGVSHARETSSPVLPPKPSAASSGQALEPPAAPKPASQKGGRTGRSTPPSRELTLATDEPSWGRPPSSEPASATDEEQRAASAPSSSSPSHAAPAAETTKEPVETEAPKPVASPGVPSSEARAFANEQAQQQLAAAANEASRCASLGATRGSGKVNVSIATWGRVVRVAHLNQAFVGTPVGVCVMEAFQKVLVPPFDGATQTVMGSFLIQ